MLSVFFTEESVDKARKMETIGNSLTICRNQISETKNNTI